MEIVAGVHQIKLPFPEGIPEQTNVYVVEGSRGNILIDSGWNSSEVLWAFREGLKENLLKFQDINWIVITHIHPDHYGLASKLKEFCGAEVAMHRVEAGLINSRYKDFDELLTEIGEELRKNGVPQAELTELKEASLWTKQFVSPDLPDVMLDDGDRLSNGSFEFEVLRTPGHSPGHICLYEPRKRWLFCGDHVLFKTTPHVGFHPQSGDNPLGEYISSLKMLGALKTNFIFPGHGPVFNSLKLRAEEILRHHTERERDIIRAMSSGLKTAYQIATEIPWVPQAGGVAFKDLAPWDKRLAMLETMAHLKLLSFEGKVGKIDQEGISLYLSTD
jgi:glyoxylase-like metal-dependent hydrolase (beta-lactamase superfamily II)